MDTARKQEEGFFSPRWPRESNPTPLLSFSLKVEGGGGIREKQFARKMKTRGGERRVGAGGFESVSGGQVGVCVCVEYSEITRKKGKRCEREIVVKLRQN